MPGLDQERQLLRQHVGAVIKYRIRLHARRLIEELGDFVPANGPQLWGLTIHDKPTALSCAFVSS
jgi:hypothetical protein